MYIQEIFYSYQGEGPWVGYPQIFIRFFGCNIKCDYCDTPDRLKLKMTPEQVIDKITPYLERKPHSISITGGEPLMQADGILELIPHLEPLNIPLFLETNATYPERLDKVKDHFTYFSVDYKPGHEDKFEQFVDRLKDNAGTYIKYIVLKDFASTELEYLGKTIQKLNQKLPIVLQPVTPFAKVTEPASTDDLHRAHKILLNYVPDIRIIPQTHKMMGII